MNCRQMAYEADMLSVVEHIDELNGDLWSVRKPKVTQRSRVQSAERVTECSQQRKRSRSLSETDKLLPAVPPRTTRLMSQTVAETKYFDKDIIELLQ